MIPPHRQGVTVRGEQTLLADRQQLAVCLPVAEFGYSRERIHHVTLHAHRATASRAHVMTVGIDRLDHAEPSVLPRGNARI